MPHFKIYLKIKRKESNYKAPLNLVQLILKNKVTLKKSYSLNFTQLVKAIKIIQTRILLIKNNVYSIHKISYSKNKDYLRNLNNSEILTLDDLSIINELCNKELSILEKICNVEEVQEIKEETMKTCLSNYKSEKTITLDFLTISISSKIGRIKYLENILQIN